MTQLVGHARTLQARVSAVCAQTSPPCSGSVQSRVRNWWPMAHDLEQVDQEDHEATVPSIAHG
jgi:hypothetical protein